MLDERTWIFIGNLWFTGLGVLAIIMSALIYFTKEGKEGKKGK